MMKNALRVLIVAILAITLIGTAAPQQQTKQEGPLPWAYGGDAPPASPPDPNAQPDTSLKHVAGSSLSFTLAQMISIF
jgi:ABC-type molybdate transport system substrate-binding protein